MQARGNSITFFQVMKKKEVSTKNSIFIEIIFQE